MEKNLEVYIAGSISRRCEKEWHSAVSKALIDMGYQTYAPAENTSINDKTNNPTPRSIYDGDVAKLKSCDILLCELHGGKQDGTIWECGMISGWNELAKMINDHENVKHRDIFVPFKEMYFYTSNSRLLNNMNWRGIPSESLNHLVIGGFDVWGDFLGSPEDMIKAMRTRMDSRLALRDGRALCS